MKVMTIIGTRPEIIKMSPLLELLDQHFDHTLVHTGQHYDPAMDTLLFKELKLPAPAVRLTTRGGDFATQLSRQLKKLQQVVGRVSPDIIIVQGDTNSALAGALVGARMKVKVVHVEAGCRSGNLRAPEEQNRLLIDAIASLHLCSDSKALSALKKEGRSATAHLVGSTTFDAIKRSVKLAPKTIREGRYALATLHRAEGMEDLEAFQKKIALLNWVSETMPVIFPVHPRTAKFLKQNRLKLHENVVVTPPLGHLPFVGLLRDCHFVLSDSGGIQEEAAFFDRPCLILRKETEWTRLVKAGKNFLLKDLSKKDYALVKRLMDDEKFYRAVRKRKSPESANGAAKKILSLLTKSK